MTGNARYKLTKPDYPRYVPLEHSYTHIHTHTYLDLGTNINNVPAPESALSTDTLQKEEGRGLGMSQVPSFFRELGPTPNIIPECQSNCVCGDSLR